MKNNRVSDALENIARRGVPENTDLWPKILSRLGKETVSMKPQFRLSWSLVLAILALILATTAAYALYRYFNDPGLQAAQEAGLITNLDMTGQPAILPPGTPFESRAGPATLIGSEQTLEGVTVRLDWIYLDETRLAFGFSARGLRADMGLEKGPAVTFIGVMPMQPQGGNFSLGGGNGAITGDYISYQVINSEVIGRGRIDLGIDIPLIRRDVTSIGDPSSAPVLANFHFDVKDVPLYRGQSLYFQQTYSVKVNGVVMRLESVTVTPSYTTARLCYDLPALDKDWIIQYAAAKFGDPHNMQFYTNTTSEVRSQTYSLIRDEGGARCVEIGIPVGNNTLDASAAEPMLKLTVRELTVPLSGDALSEERIFAANDELAQYGIEIAPAEAGAENGPGGWKYVRCDHCNEQDYSLQVMDVLEEAWAGPWEFYVDLVRKDAIPGLVPPTPTPEPPLASQTVGDLKATLDWAYADANRAAFQIHFDGWKENYTLMSGALVKDKAGKELGNVYSAQTPELDPSAMIMIFNPSDPAVLEDVDHVDLQIDLPVFTTGNFDSAFASFHFDLSLKVYPALTMTPEMSVLENGIEMQIRKVRISPSYTSIYACFKKPTIGLPSDWLVSSTATLEIGGIIVNIAQAETLFDADYGGYMGKGPKPGDLPTMDGGRCVELGFPLGHRNRAETMTLTIPQLEQSAPEAMPDDQIQAARQKLKAQGIEMDWITISSSGGGGGGPLINKKPEGMTDEEVMQRFFDALGYYYAGPWTFTVEVRP